MYYMHRKGVKMEPFSTEIFHIVKGMKIPKKVPVHVHPRFKNLNSNPVKSGPSRVRVVKLPAQQVSFSLFPPASPHSSFISSIKVAQTTQTQTSIPLKLPSSKFKLKYPSIQALTPNSNPISHGHSVTKTLNPQSPCRKSNSNRSQFGILLCGWDERLRA